MKRISDTGIEITNRFFEAVDELKRQKVIRGLKTFTTRFNANRCGLVAAKDNPATNQVKPEYLTYLVEGYGVSADWLLTGRGEMFKGVSKAKHKNL